jgi:hypothetical protein
VYISHGVELNMFLMIGYFVLEMIILAMGCTLGFWLAV